MQKETSNPNIQNTNLENFIQFINKSEIYYFFENYTMHSIDEIKYEDKIECCVFYNKFTLEEYNSFLKNIFDNVINEIIDNIEINSNNYFHAYKYLNEFLNKISPLDKVFDHAHLRNKVIDLTREHAYKDRIKYPFILYEEVKGFRNIAKEYIEKIKDFINKCQEEIKKYNFTTDFPKIIFHKKIAPEKSIKYDSFYYININKDPERINNFYESLLNNKFIFKEETTVKNFKKVFTKDPIETKVIWHGGILSLRYLIRTLRKKNLITYPLNKQFELITKCFELCDNKIILATSINSNEPCNDEIKKHIDIAIGNLY